MCQKTFSNARSVDRRTIFGLCPFETKLTVAAAWLTARRSARAERVFKAVLDLDPANVRAEIGMAITATMRRDFLTAEAALKRAIGHDPGRAALYQTLAQVYDETGREGEAGRMMKIARRLGAVSA